MYKGRFSRLNRPTDQRQAMERQLVTSLLEKEQIVTTVARARWAARQAEKMITLAKRGDLHARRQALAFVIREDVVKKLFDVLGPRYRDRDGGYTRVLKMGFRRGDGAPLAVVKLV